MSITIPRIEPENITAGDTVKWTKTLNDYPANDGWTLSYALVHPEKQIALTSAASGADHLITITAAASAAYPPGLYHWQSYATKTTERYLVGTGRINVLVNFATQAVGHDARSYTKKMLDALEAMILGKASLDQSSYAIGGRSLSRLTPSEVEEWLQFYRGEYARELQAEKIAKGLGYGSKVLVRF